MKKGAAVVNNENLSNQEIKVELNQLELKYKLKELDAKLMSEKEDLQTWILSGKLDEHKGTKTIERKPTKANSEEDVSEADRQLHQRIAGEVKAQLEAKGKSTEGVETFEEFYGLLQSEAVLLQKKYQPQLRNGIKIAVDLVNSVKQDEKDGDVDVRIKIAPNKTEEELRVEYEKTSPPGTFKLHPGTFSQHEADPEGKIYNVNGEEKQIHLLARHGSTAADVEARINAVDIYSQFSDFREKLIDNDVKGKGKGLTQKIAGNKHGITTYESKQSKYPTKFDEYEDKISVLRDKNEEYEKRVVYLKSILSTDKEKMKKICDEERYSLAFSSTKFKNTEIMYESILEALDIKSLEIDHQLTNSLDGSTTRTPKKIGSMTRKPIRHTLTKNIGVGYELNNEMEIEKITRPIETVEITLIVSDDDQANPLYKVYTAYPKA